MTKARNQLRSDFLLMLGLVAIVAIGSQAGQKNPALTTEKTGLDAQFSAAVLPEVRSKFKSDTVTDRQLQSLIELASHDYRSEHPNTVVEPGKFAAYVVEGYGFLSVHSDPPGAEVWVDRKQWDGLTDIDNNGTKAGEKTVKVKKLGFEEETGTVEVRAGNFALFYRKLKKQS
jgi:hypothetical protein